MPSHQDRVRRNYCEHEYRYIYGVDVAHLYHDAMICTKCNKIVDIGVIGIGPSWNEKTADLSHLQQDIKDLLK